MEKRETYLFESGLLRQMANDRKHVNVKVRRKIELCIVTAAIISLGVCSSNDREKMTAAATK